jgi:hypothetical protein
MRGFPVGLGFGVYPYFWRFEAGGTLSIEDAEQDDCGAKMGFFSQSRA